VKTELSEALPWLTRDKSEILWRKINGGMRGFPPRQNNGSSFFDFYKAERRDKPDGSDQCSEYAGLWGGGGCEAGNRRGFGSVTVREGPELIDEGSAGREGERRSSCANKGGFINKR